MPWVLDIHKENKVKESIPMVDSVLSIGREDCDINLEDPKLSRNHCSFYMHEESLTVVNNSSTNGTFVNGRKVDKQELKNSDNVTIGSIKIIVRKV